MLTQYPLFQSHRDLSHYYWKQLVKSDDIVIDATCGNGNDTLALAQLNGNGRVIVIDVQSDAITMTKKKLAEGGVVMDRVDFVHGSHEKFPEDVLSRTVKLIVYNLGYLPSGNKQKTTMVESTIRSITEAKKLIVAGGAISITCYPGHGEGEKEQVEILKLVASWDPKEWSCCHHQWLNRQKSPSLLLLQKGLD